VIKIEDLRVEVGSFSLKDLSLEISDGEYFILLGPTGAGKTVLLEAIAGLNRVSKGRILLNNRNITDWKPEKRGVGIVYQDHALFPHLSIRENILFGLKLRKTSTAEKVKTEEWVVSLLGINYLLERRAATLSGGERQKVALARALKTRPEVLLLDEPLSALDPATRESVQEELRRLHTACNNTIIHVTHDFEEAMSLGTRIAVIGEGRLRQVGTPEDIFRHPASAFVARFGLARNVFQGVITTCNNKKVFRTNGMEIQVASELEGLCYASIRPEDIVVETTTGQNAEYNHFSGRVTRITDKGAVINLTVDIPPALVCMLSRSQFSHSSIREGTQLSLYISPTQVSVFRDE